MGNLPPACAPLQNCRVCGSGRITELFSLGIQAVSDFVTKEKINDGQKVPITLVQCRECTLVQQLYTAPQDFMYTRHYWYHSGMTHTMRVALYDVTYNAMKRVQLERGDIVLDIGSNDGTLLRSYPNCGVVRVGVEPAKNLQTEGKDGVDILINDFWNISSYMSAVTGWKADDLGSRVAEAKIITACGMFYDLVDPNTFIRDVSLALHQDGVFVAQLMCAKQMYNLGDVGNLAHEHLEFYTLRSLEVLFAKHDLKIVDVEENNVNGGSYRLYIKHTSAKMSEHETNRVQHAFESEGALERPEEWNEFYARACMNRDKCVDFIRQQQKTGIPIWVYGASTKGNVILQWYGLNSRLIDGAYDKSVEKQGLFTIGTGIPILGEQDFNNDNPNYAVCMPYTFLQEFIVREKEWRDNGGRFIVPLPEFKVV